MNYIPDERIGRVRIPVEHLDRDFDEARKPLDGAFVLRAEMMAYLHSFEYILWHPDFPEVEMGFEAPIYTPAYERVEIEGGYKIRFVGFEELMEKAA